MTSGQLMFVFFFVLCLFYGQCMASRSVILMIVVSVTSCACSEPLDAYSEIYLLCMNQLFSYWVVAIIESLLTKSARLCFLTLN